MDADQQQQLAPIPFGCRFGWHRWLPWVPAELTATYRYHTKSYTYMGQKRTCAGCGKEQING